MTNDDADVTGLPVRPLVLSDLDAIKGIIGSVGLFDPAMLDDMAGPFLSGQADGAFWLTLTDDPRPIAVAYCAAEPMTDGAWNMLLIAVQAERHGQGHGSLLTGHVESAVLERGGRILLVETSGLPEFARTRAFYAKKGYREEARIRNYYRDGDDKVVFCKALTPKA